MNRYTHWLHTRWPAGTIEKLPVTGADGATNVPGVRVVGDLTGIPLLKFSADTGARAVQAVAEELRKDGVLERWSNEKSLPLQHSTTPPLQHSILDLAIIGAGVSGIAAALEAKKAGLTFQVFEAVQPFSTIVNFPKGKPIYTYPTEMTPAGELRFKANVKEALVEELEAQRQAAGIEPVALRIERIERQGDALALHAGKEQIRARRVIVAIGRSGNYRKLGVPGEDLDKVYNRLYDPKEYGGKHVLVVGGGDSALESAIALAVCGAHVTLSYRGKEFSRPKPGNIEKIAMLQRDPQARTGVEQPKSERVNTAMDADNAGAHPPGSLRVMMASKVEAIRADAVVVDGATIPNDVVFVMIGREAPLDFFRRSKIAIRGEWTRKTWVCFALFALFSIWLYHWKAHAGPLAELGKHIPEFIAGQVAGVSASAKDPRTLWGVVANAAKQPSFYYSLSYCTVIVVFGLRRMARRKTPYVRLQTLTLMAVQCLPLFLLPYILLPWLGANGAFDAGLSKAVADQFFPIPSYSPDREYWRAFGFVLAWPLFIWNLFTDHPTTGWLVLGLVQTFVIIPLIVWRWGKGAYCGWICSCGALAETLGDTHRQKMPHGPTANRWNMAGQVILGIAMLLLGLRILAWLGIDWFNGIYYGLLSGWPIFNYSYMVDLWLAGVMGVAAYFWFSGRVWCRFACPLAALMHIYARFSRFRIFPEKSKCISCNVCTSVCHQGIDIMNFANKGLPMEDPQCVRCSACVQECPTGVLAFGRFGPGNAVVLDKLPASPVRMREGTPSRIHNG